MILCSQEEYDSILGIPRPNGSSKSWYLRETKRFHLPLPLMPYNIFDEDDNLWSEEQLLSQTQEHNIPSLKYKYYDDLDDEHHLYIITIHNSDFFQQNKNLGFSVIDERIINDVKIKKCKIILTILFEGYSGREENEDFDILNDWCLKNNFDKDDVYFINGNLLTDDIIKKNNYNFLGFGISTFEDWLEPKKIDKPLIYNVNDKKSKLFLSYNRAPRAHRYYLIAELFKNNLLDDGIISFFEENVEDSLFNEILNESEKIKLQNKIPLIANGGIDYKKYNPSNNICTFHNEQTFLSLVSETLVDKNTLFISEKTWKPILTGHPFIIFGNKGTLKYLKSRGYQTFSDWWDESYDDMDEFTDRLKSIIKILNNLKKLSKEKLAKMREEMNSVLTHNFLLFKREYKEKFFKNGQFYNTELEKIYTEIYLKLKNQ